jgi:sec-independent protein translocase protein TatA
MGVTFAFLSPTTMIVVVIVALLVFGPHKMPELMRQLGQALREFKKITGDVQGVFNVDDHLHYDRYDPPSYSSYSHPTYEPLDQYQPDAEHSEEIKALPATEDAAEPEKPKRKRAPRKKPTTEVAEAPAPEETDTIVKPSETTEDKELKP